MLLNHRLGAGMQISRPRVVAQPCPEPEHFVERRQRECAHVGQRAVKRAKYGATALTVVCCSMTSESHTR